MSTESPSNIPFALIALVPLLAWIGGLVLVICLIIWVFHIRKATRETAEETKKVARTMSDIYQLLLEQNMN